MYCERRDARTHHSTERVPQFVRTHIEEHLRLTPVLLGVGGTLLDDLDMRSFDLLLVGNVGLGEEREASVIRNKMDFDRARQPQDSRLIRYSPSRRTGSPSAPSCHGADSGTRRSSHRGPASKS